MVVPYTVMLLGSGTSKNSPVFQRYVTLRLLKIAATQLVSNPTLSQILLTVQCNVCLIQEDCQMGQNSYMGWPTGTTYIPYSPFETLLVVLLQVFGSRKPS